MLAIEGGYCVKSEARFPLSSRNLGRRCDVTASYEDVAMSSQ